MRRALGGLGGEPSKNDDILSGQEITKKEF